ncbi:stage II sporulation protein P [Chryseomicrobium palamuruense]|uniref:Stage II sporulation protein P n=1 Tax=Chryseomicrobium palamuruense TaxID=682973 RepID=A0ABV8UZW2_9BACL
MIFFIPFIFLLYLPSQTTQTIAQAEAQPSGNWKEESIAISAAPNKRLLFLFTHSHEAYPGQADASGSIPVYHATKNITTFHPVIEQAFLEKGMQASLLEIDAMQLLSKHQKSFDQAYNVIRPHLLSQIQADSFEYVIDFHRDSAGRKVTALKSPKGSFAKVLFIVGGEHAGYAANLELAKRLSARLEAQIPGISRGVAVKSGIGVDGVYNQDLHPKSLLIELGGIENTQAEVEATIRQIAIAFENLE